MRSLMGVRTEEAAFTFGGVDWEAPFQRPFFRKITEFQKQPKEGPQKCPVYLRLPWIGNESLKFEK